VSLASITDDWHKKNRVWKIEPYENPDWDYARNKHILLKTSFAEYSASVFTSSLEIGRKIFYGPNNDYSWQGLLVGPLEGNVYKALDSVYFSCSNAILKPRDVIFEPGKCVYRYTSEEAGSASVQFALTDQEDGALLEILAAQPCWFMIFLASISGDSFGRDSYDVKIEDEQLTVRRSGIPVPTVIRGFDRSEPLNLELEWRYKLGDGFRRREDGSVKFIPHFRRIYAPLMLYTSTGHLEIKVPFPRDSPAEYAVVIPKEKLQLGENPIARAVSLRFRTLSTYSSFLGQVWFPEAGAWWFRKPWTRDLMEGIRWNLRTYVEVLGWERRVTSLVNCLLDTLKSSNGLPIIVGTETQPTSDAPPELLYVGSVLSRTLGNHALLLKVVDVAGFLCERLLRGLAVSGTRIHESVLCSPANSSWTDSVVELDGRLWPIRLPYEWMKRGMNALSGEFALVEVNALYIQALDTLTATCGELGVKVPEKVHDLLRVIRDGFRRHFKNDEKLPPLTIAPSQGLRDQTIGSPAVVAVSALTGIEYNDEELNVLWKIIARRLLIYRKSVLLDKQMLPFGILVRDVERVPYLGDKEYHGATIWPRDTPYLLPFMERLGEDVTGLLVSNLDHMVSEGAIGYCNELFSLPVGENPSPCLESQNPVPVKNPAQYWSHWCDPYLDHLSEILSDRPSL
jgi:hypothetical protein